MRVCWTHTLCEARELLYSHPLCSAGIVLHSLAKKKKKKVLVLFHIHSLKKSAGIVSYSLAVCSIDLHQFFLHPRKKGAERFCMSIVKHDTWQRGGLRRRRPTSRLVSAVVQWTTVGCLYTLQNLITTQTATGVVPGGPFYGLSSTPCWLLKPGSIEGGEMVRRRGNVAIN